jgi:heat shock protein HtpX
MSQKTVSYTIEPQIPSTYTGKLFDFIYKGFLLRQTERYRVVSRTTTQDKPSISYEIKDASGNQNIEVEIIGSKPLSLTINPLNEKVSEKEISQAKENIDLVIDYFEDQVRQNAIFFAWREGESIVPESVSGNENSSLRQLFSETQIMLMLLFMGAGLFLFYIVGPFLPIIILAIQFLFVFYSDKLVARTADWAITEANPTIHLLQYPLPIEEDNKQSQKISDSEILKLKKEIYDETIAKSGTLNCQIAQPMFSKYGIDCNQENLIATKINVYETVKKVADRFGFPTPKIVVSNTRLPNAAASGPSPSRGIILITTGLFAQLDEDEIINVLGHEFGHLKGRDPLWLYGLTAVQYLLWFYLIFGAFSNISYFTFFIYFWGIMTLTYFFAKFFEARADLISVLTIKQPDVFAEALEKIGFKRLLLERNPLFRVQEWLSFDPHPPIYFRIDRLKKIGPDTEIKHPLIRSAREVFWGFLHSFS